MGPKMGPLFVKTVCCKALKTLYPKSLSDLTFLAKIGQTRQAPNPPLICESEIKP